MIVAGTVAAAAGTAAGQTPPSRAAAEQRYQIGQMERVLEGAVEHGLTITRDFPHPQTGSPSGWTSADTDPSWPRASDPACPARPLARRRDRPSHDHCQLPRWRPRRLEQPPVAAVAGLAAGPGLVVPPSPWPVPGPRSRPTGAVSSASEAAFGSKSWSTRPEPGPHICPAVRRAVSTGWSPSSADARCGSLASAARANTCWRDRVTVSRSAANARRSTCDCCVSRSWPPVTTCVNACNCTGDKRSGFTARSTATSSAIPAGSPAGSPVAAAVPDAALSGCSGDAGVGAAAPFLGSAISAKRTERQAIGGRLPRSCSCLAPCAVPRVSLLPRLQQITNNNGGAGV